MKTVNVILRILLGLILFVFGLNKFLHFMPMPPAPEAAGSFFMALVASGYVLTLVAFFEVVIGVLLIINRFVPLALLLLAPLTVNFIGFHLSLDPGGIMIAAVVTILNVYFFYVNRKKYTEILKAK